MEPKHIQISVTFAITFSHISATFKVVDIYYISMIPTILTPWLYKESYEKEQMDAGTTGHVDAWEICPMRVYLLCTTTPHGAVKTEPVCHAWQYLQTLKFPCFAVGISILQCRVCQDHVTHKNWYTEKRHWVFRDTVWVTMFCVMFVNSMLCI